MIKVYIAHPLEAHEAPEGSSWADPEANFRRYLEVCATFTQAGFTVVSWAHHYLMHTQGLTQGDAGFYLDRDDDLVKASDVLVVAGPAYMSAGMRREIITAQDAGVPVVSLLCLEDYGNWFVLPKAMLSIKACARKATSGARLIAAVQAEVKRARAAWPSPDHLTLALGEEVGEVQQAILHHHYECGILADVRTELIQVICVAVRLLEEGDPTVGLPPSVEAS